MNAFICDGVRTPIGRYGGALSSVRTDDLGAVPLQALMARHPGLDWERLDEVVYGCVNQAGEDNRNVARMSALLAGLPVGAAAVTVNRLCGSGLEAVAATARGLAAGHLQLAIAGGVESMSRAPLVMPKPTAAFSRHAEVHDDALAARGQKHHRRDRAGPGDHRDPHRKDRDVLDLAVALDDEAGFGGGELEKARLRAGAGRPRGIIARYLRTPG